MEFKFILPAVILTAALNAQPVLMFLGDSLTAGRGLTEADAYPALIEKRFADSGKKIKVINAGISGDTTAGGLKRLPWLLKAKPDAVFVALGSNDGLRGLKPEMTRSNLSKIVSTLTSKKIKVFLAGAMVPENYGDAYSREFKKIFVQTASENKINFYPFILEGVALQPQYNQADGIHPNAEGQKILADKIFKFLAPFYAKQDAK